MSAPTGDKQSKAKTKKSSINKSTKHKGKEASINDEKFRGDGVIFKCKLLGVSEVTGPRGDNMCIEAIKKLKQHIKQTGEHKQKILLNITLKGIRVFDEKSKNVMFEHPVNKISFITHDPEDKKIFGYICSMHSKTGHVMYAIKYDKVAGIITATLYELFQAVFKMRQEAALQKRAQSQNQSNARANTTAVTNGPSTATPTDETNIYEEPKSSPSPVKTQADNNSDGHYKVPLSRPLPPAPYGSSAGKDSPQIGHQEIKTSQPQSVDSPATNFASESFFSASVFTQSESAADTVSMSSVDIIRKESISSSSSETASFDSRSLDLKSGHAVSTPPTARQRPVGLTSPAVTNPERPVALEAAARPDEDHDYETIPNSSNYETIPGVPRTEKKEDTNIEFKGFTFKESFSDLEPFPRSDSLNDTSAQKNLSVQGNLTSGAFGDDDLFKSFGDSNFNDMAFTTSSSVFPKDDPFAPTTAPQESQSQTTDAFVSNDPFVTAFEPKGSDNSDIKQEECSGDVSEDSVVNKQTESGPASDHFEAVFGTTDMSPLPFKPKEEIKKNDEDVNDTLWGSVTVKNNEKTTADTEDKKSEKSEESKAEFKWDDSFGMNFNSTSENEAQSGSSDVKNEVSWSTAFDTKQPQSEVSFSWDDTFGGTAVAKDGETKNNFEGVSFEDAFASTPFKDSGSKTEPAFPYSEDSFGNFGALKSTVQDTLKADKVPNDDVSGETENEPKPKLADDEDLPSSSDKEIGSENEKKTIPKVIEPISEDHSNDATTEDLTRPKLLPFQPAKPKDEVTSPNVPPPLPPRARAALPVLPPRPRTHSSPVPSEIPPTPPRPAASSGMDSKGKRAPPALPPRIDLEIGNPHANSNPPVPISIDGFSPDAFSSPKNEETSISWQGNWKNEASKKDKENATNSTTSPDPFGDNFFTDFDFSAAKDTSTKPNEVAHDKQMDFADPFLAKDGADDMFKAEFGGKDPFADFTSNNKGIKNDPFMSDGEGAFPGFSTNNDPFSDVNDPFADKNAVNDDPFGTHPKKEEAENISFQLSKDSSDGDFTDSFA